MGGSDDPFCATRRCSYSGIPLTPTFVVAAARRSSTPSNRLAWGMAANATPSPSPASAVGDCRGADA